MTNLEEMGWDQAWQAKWRAAHETGVVPGRVTAMHRGSWAIWTAEGELAAELAGRFRHHTARADLPATGDWVAVRVAAGGGPALVVAVLPRRTHLIRKTAGEATTEQVLAANVDVAFLVAGLDGDFSPRRLERALVLAREGGVEPVVVLNKADLLDTDSLEARVRVAEAVAPGVPIVAMSAATGTGAEALSAWLLPGRTVALLGSSGVGKSTLVNRLLGYARQRTASVREHDSRGRHTTSHREILRLPGGALLLDTPGLRELQLWAGAGVLEAAFADVEELAGGCRYADCRHEREPGCAVVEAVRSGTLDAGRFESYHKLQREARHLALRQDELGRREEKVKWRAIHKAARKHRPRE